MPLGSLLLLLEDSGCSQPATLLQYWLAEGVASGHRGLWVAPAAHGDLRLPRLSADQKASKVTTQSMDCSHGCKESMYLPCSHAGCQARRQGCIQPAHSLAVPAVPGASRRLRRCTGL